MQNNQSLLKSVIIMSAGLIALALIFRYNRMPGLQSTALFGNSQVQPRLIDAGHILPVTTEQKMLSELVKYGVIDGSKLPQVTELNLLWAYGLANANPVLKNGPIMNPRYGGPENMASVGGWTVSAGPGMDHFGMHDMASLNFEQQNILEKIAGSVYRPCCQNSTLLPDCNHGMAMLGLLEYLSSQGAIEGQMQNAAKSANAIWFPDQQTEIPSKSTSPQPAPSECVV